MPQTGLSFAASAASKLESQPVDTVSDFANAPVIKVEFTGVWQPWGTSKTDMRRPAGHAETRFRLHAHENGGPQAVGFDFLEASITFGAR